MSTASSKGKGKTTERTPLLGRNGDLIERTPQQVEYAYPAISRVPMRLTWRSHLLTAALVLLTFTFALLLAIALLVESYAAPALRNIDHALSQPEGDTFWGKAVLLSGPDAINVVSISRTEDERGVLQSQINVSVTVRMTVDTDFVMGFYEDPTQADSWWTRRWKDIGRWGIRRMGSTTAALDEVIVYPASPPTAAVPLLTISPLSPIPISLSPGLSAKDNSTVATSVTIPFIVRLSQNATSLLEFVDKSWARAFVSVRLQGFGLQIYGGNLTAPTQWLGQWRNWLKFKKSEISLHLNATIPPLHTPSHPPTEPGSPLPPFSDFLTLESFSITSISSATLQASQSETFHSLFDSASANSFRGQKGSVHEEHSILTAQRDDPKYHFSSSAGNVIITALASLAHPFSTLASKLELIVPPIPFMVALPFQSHRNSSISALSNAISVKGMPPDLIPVAQVFAVPSLNVTHVRIPLSGHLLSLSSSSSDLADAISTFASSYLSYKPAAIAVFTPFYPSVIVRAFFPPPSTRLDLVRDVTIENMKIRPGLGPIFAPDSLVSQSTDPPLGVLGLLASATIHARVVLPPGMNIDVRVGRLWIDCFVFDGEVPPEVFRDTNSGNSQIMREGQPALISEADEPPVPKPRPLPDPLPERAVARITPSTWLNASSVRLPSSIKCTSDNGECGRNEGDNNETGTNVYVTANIVDVPLEVLPGREDEFSKFVAKIVFSKEPVIAGIRGVAAVGVSVPGITGPAPSEPRGGSELILAGLPFKGNLKIGGRSF